MVKINYLNIYSSVCLFFQWMMMRVLFILCGKIKMNTTIKIGIDGEYIVEVNNKINP